MSFDSMKRSNSRHNFVAKQDHGQLPSQSPFYKSVTNINADESASPTTAVKWSEVDPTLRVSTAKRELQMKLKSRHSTTHQIMDKTPEPVTRGESDMGLPSVKMIKPPLGVSASQLAASESAGIRAINNGEKGVLLLKAEQDSVLQDPKLSPVKINGPREDDSSDDETAADVYGWRFDAEGEAENDENLRCEVQVTDKQKVDKDSDLFNEKSHEARNFTGSMFANLRSSFNTSIQNLASSFSGSHQSEHPVLRTAKELSQYAGSTLLKTASFAARAAIRISSKMAEDVSQWVSQDEADRVGRLVARSSSHMVVHDLGNSPTKEKVKKQRLQDLHEAINEMRRFGHEQAADGDSSSPPKSFNKKSSAKSLLHATEEMLHKFAFPDANPAPAPEAVLQKSIPIDRTELQLDKHSIVFTPQEQKAIPDDKYKTLLNVRDTKDFHQEYFGPQGKGIPVHNPREAYMQHIASSTVDKDVGLVSNFSDVNSHQTLTSSNRPSGQQLNHSIPSMKQDRSKPLHISATSGSSLGGSAHSLCSPFNRPNSNDLMSSTQPNNHTQSNLKRGRTFSTLPHDADWDVGRSPGGGLPPLRGSSYRAPSAPASVPEDDTPAYVKQLKATGSFLKSQLAKVKSHLTSKLPKLSSAPVLRISTGKERIPPEPTATNGFQGTQSYVLDQKQKHESEQECTQEQEPGQRLPFSLLSSAKRSSSFAAGLGISLECSSDADLNATKLLPNTGHSSYHSATSLSERHKSMISQASPGVGLPVIYAPQTARSEVSEASLYSHVTSLTNMLEVSDNQRQSLRSFRPRSMKHLELSKVAEVSNHVPDDVSAYKRMSEAADVGPELAQKDIGGGWQACWDKEAGSVYYFNTETGEATWLPPNSRQQGEDEDEGDLFSRIENNGLPRGLSELNMGDSELTIKTRKIAARHNLFSKLRSRYEGDKETEYTKGFIAKEYADHAVAEENEILKDMGKELDGW